MTVFVDTFLLVALALLVREMAAAMPCIIGQEPDPATGNNYRWVIPVKDPCQCTQVRVGGRTSTHALCRPFPVTYYDSFFESDDPAEIRRLLNCPGTARCSPEEPLGMEDGRIPDESITASSIFNDWIHGCGPERGRLNFAGQTWIPKSTDLSPWIQVDFKEKVYITGVITQGRGNADERTTKYRVMYSDDGNQWTDVLSAEGTIAEFEGNVDRNSQVTARLQDLLYTRVLRIVPTEWRSLASMRFEVLGCMELY